MSDLHVSTCPKCQGTLTSLGYCYTCKIYPELHNFSFVSNKTTLPEAGLHDHIPDTGEGTYRNAFSRLAAERQVMKVEIPETIIHLNQEEREKLSRILCMAGELLNRGCRENAVSPTMSRAGIEYANMSKHLDFVERLNDNL